MHLPRSTKKSAPPLLVVLLAAALFAAGCGSDDGDDATTGAQPAAESDAAGDAPPAADEGETAPEQASKPEPKPEPKGTEIKLGDSQFGEVLFDDSDQAIYLFDKETSSESECYGDCAVAWPPVLTKGEPQGEGGVSQKLLGTTERDDGSTQVTYDGQPLYYYHDEGPGEVLCHNVPGFGGIWLVLGADGKAL